MVTFLHCSTNNKAQTVQRLFQEAISTYGTPRQIRTDHGTENVEVARCMLDHFGVKARPVITDLSVHNQRIERFWRDVHNYVGSIFSDLFYIEGHDLLDPLSEEHLIALYYVFSPRINNCINSFTRQWNFHPIRTEGNLSPYRLWTQGCYRFARSNDTAVSDLMNQNVEDFLMYGVDESVTPGELQTNDNVDIHPSVYHCFK